MSKSYKKVSLKSDEVVVPQEDFGFLVEEFINKATRPRNTFNEKWLDQAVRRWWPMIEEYYQRHVQCAIEVAIALDEPPRYNREELSHKEMWKKIIADLRPPKSPFTVKYVCDFCKKDNVKLWRESHLFAKYIKLKCATCLAPDEKVTEEGKCEYRYEAKDVSGNQLPSMMTDQVKGWVPAIPVGDTYWGYSSVPSQDVEWWIKLPTYPSLKIQYKTTMDY